MKRLLFLIAVIFLTSALFAQEKSNYEKYWEAREDSIVKSQLTPDKPITNENLVNKSNKPATIFDKHKEILIPQTSVVYTDTDDDVNIYVVEPFSYSMFYDPFAFSFSFGIWGYPYYGLGYGWGYPYYDPWYYPYYGWGYPYYGYGYGYPYYGYGRGYYPHDGDRGYGALGWHGYGSGYHNYNSGSIVNKNFSNSYPTSRRYSSRDNFNSKSVTQSSARSYVSPGNKPTYRQNRGSSSTYTRPEMSTRPKYNNTPTQSNTFSSRQRTNTQYGSYNRSSSPSKNSFAGQQRSRTSTQQSRSYSTPRSSAPSQSRSSYSAPASRSYSSPSHSSGGSFGGGSTGSRSYGGHSSGGRR